MGVIIVPFDYREENDTSVVPICIADVDSEGTPIHRGWVQHGVVPVADVLRKIARQVLRDPWRVSEITETVVHSLSRKYAAALGDDPSLRVLKRARWYADDLRAGSRRARRKTEVDLFAAKLQTLQDKFDLTINLEAKDTLDRLMEALDHQNLHDVREMVPMMLQDCEPHEFVTRFRKSRNALSQRFYRGTRKAASVASITW